MRSFLYIFFALHLFFLFGCTGIKPVATDAAGSHDSDLAQFAAMLSGWYSNEAQAQSDSSYLHVLMMLTPVWHDTPDIPDGIWLYVEQALASNPDSPYRQRIYRLTHPSQEYFHIDTYEMADAMAFAGLHNDALKQQQLRFDGIELKEGCTVRFVFKDGIYLGGTSGKNCLSDWRGAMYMESEVRLEEGIFYTWDRGFDASGIQVWGPPRAGYVFMKISNIQ